jgi:CheY-like chemotaxis protein
MTTAHTGKILIIDDNAINVELLGAYLSGAGYQTLSAYEGRSGLEIAIGVLDNEIENGQWDPGLVTTFIQMMGRSLTQ